MIGLLEREKRNKGVFEYISILNTIECIARVGGSHNVENMAEWLLTIGAHNLPFYKLSKTNDISVYGNYPHGINSVNYSKELLKDVKLNVQAAIRASEFYRPFWKIEDIIALIDFDKTKEDELLKDFDATNIVTHIRPALEPQDSHALLKRKYLELKFENSKLKEKLANTTSAKNPTDFTTPGMDIMYEVISEYWQDHDFSKPTPKQDSITNWITTNYPVSSALALCIDKVCRPTNAKQGGKFKRNPEI